MCWRELAFGKDIHFAIRHVPRVHIKLTREIKQLTEIYHLIEKRERSAHALAKWVCSWRGQNRNPKIDQVIVKPRKLPSLIFHPIFDSFIEIAPQHIRLPAGDTDRNGAQGKLFDFDKLTQAMKRPCKWARFEECLIPYRYQGIDQIVNSHHLYDASKSLIRPFSIGSHKEKPDHRAPSGRIDNVESFSSFIHGG